ncbi:HAMP domain-containing sensor histidine kinase [Lachnospiraceae bacterium 38-14]
MNVNLFLLIAFCIALLFILFLVTKLRRVRGQLSIIEEALEDIKSGNLNRRMLTKKNDMTRKICYGINDIAMNSRTQLIRQKQSEQAYKRLMTSISHDVKTPLASLVGYLEAIECKIVAGEEKDEYVHVAFEKANYLKHFVENLFEWVKLDSGEQIFHFEVLDLNELSRNIIVDWISVLENSNFDYVFDIPETEYLMRIDANAYSRILNNLLQNALIHSKGSKISFHIFENDLQAKITMTDNGKGMSPDHLPHIFERMYQCDQSRSAGGNGLGLSIVKELVAAHKGTITVDSTLGRGTTFTLLLPKSL